MAARPDHVYVGKRGLNLDAITYTVYSSLRQSENIKYAYVYFITVIS